MTDHAIDAGADAPATEERASTDDLASVLSAAYDELAGDAEAPAEQEAEAAPEDASGRDEKGRFKAKEAEEAPEATETEQPEAKADEKPAKAEEEAPKPDDTEPGEAPRSWAEDAKAAWKDVPAPVREAIAKREQEIERGLQRQAETAKPDVELAKEVRTLFTPFAEQMRQNGVNEAAAVKFLTDAHSHYLRDPVGYIQWAAQQAGFKVDVYDRNDQPVQHNPEVAQLRKELQELQSQSLTQARTAEEQRKQEALAEIEAFAKDHPHFETVKAHMGALIQSGAAQSLNDAYEQAIWANPQVRQTLMADQEAKARAEAEKAAEAARAEAERKRAAAKSISGAPSGGSPGALPASSLREELERQFAAMN